MFLAVFWSFQFSILTIGYLAFFSWLLALSIIDLDTMTLPDPLTKSGIILGIVFQIAVGFFSEQNTVGVLRHLMMGISGAVVGLWLFDIISTIGFGMFGQTAMGGGDGKLAAMMGVWLGWRYLLLAVFIACVLGVIVGGGEIILAKHKIRKNMVFGHFLSLGAVITVFSGEALLSRYLQLFVP
jgi:leader peptidase (prepilin peptidase)/N-methyltransferase